MKSTNDDFVDRLRSESDIVSVISDYVPLKKKGKNFWGCCPFHHEKTPSFSVTPDKGFFYCFGCGAGGNVFNFLMKIENIDFFDAVKLLAQKLNIPLPEREKTDAERMREKQIARLVQANQLAADFYHSCLTRTNYGKEALDYLMDRQITPEIIEIFQLGFAPPFWNKLSQALLERSVSLAVLEESGLAVKRQSGDGFYDRFRSRIIFPIVNLRGQPIAFGGRVLDNSQPKYLNSPETPIYNKRRELFGLDKTYKAIRDQKKVVIVEGYFDAVSLYGAGITCVAASLGTAFTAEQAKVLLKFTDEFYFAYDSDAAGQNATSRAIITASEAGAKVKIIQIPEGKDPDEYVRRHGGQAFAALMDKALTAIAYEVERALGSIDHSHLEGKAAVISQVVPFLAQAHNAVEINAHISRLAAVLTIDEGTIREELRKYPLQAKKDKTVKGGYTSNVLSLAGPKVGAAEQAERHLMHFLFQDASILPYVESMLGIGHFSSPVRQEIMAALSSDYSATGKIDPEGISLRLSQAAAAELSGIMLLETPCEDKVRLVDDYIRAIELAFLKNQYDEHRLKADELERMGDSRFLQELAESQRIKHEINKLYQ